MSIILRIDSATSIHPIKVERLFHRMNQGGTDMLSFAEFERFMHSKDADCFLNELYIKYYTTTCPVCGAMCQRDGGACNNVTCSMCRTTFKCNTKAEDPLYGNFGGLTRFEKDKAEAAYQEGLIARERAERTAAVARADANRSRYEPCSRVLREHTPAMKDSSLLSRSGLVSTTASGLSPRANDTSMLSSVRGGTSLASPRSPVAGSNRPMNSARSQRSMFERDDDIIFAPYTAASSKGDPLVRMSVASRQRSARDSVMQALLKMLDLDNVLQGEKEKLWEGGVNAEAAFGFLDRYSKGYIADTDLWQVMHAESPVSFAGICQLLRDYKNPRAKMQGIVLACASFSATKGWSPQG